MYCNLIFLLILHCGVSFGAANLRNYGVYYDVRSFKYYETLMTWNDARLFCQRKGGLLASPTSIPIRDIMKHVLNRVTSKADIFIGIHSTFAAEFYNSLDGTPLPTMPQSWANPEHLNVTGTEKCIALNSNGEMLYAKCDEMKPFICYEKQIDENVCGTLDAEYHIDNRTNKCYKYHTEPRNFKEAYLICNAEGGHLVIINSEVEAQVIRDIFARYPEETIPGDFWKGHAAIGFYYWSENSDWMTIQGQSIQEAGYAKFDAGEPNNQNNDEYCGSVRRNGLLNDAPCSYRYSFICEKDPVAQPIFPSSDDTTSV